MVSLLWIIQFLWLLLSQAINCSSSSFPNVSSSTQVCAHDQAIALLHFRNSFSIDFSNLGISQFCGYQYTPKTESWKEGTDCCYWDGVTCDMKTGKVIELDLRCRMLYGTLHPNSTLFFLRHLQRLDLSLNDFNFSLIPPLFGRFIHLTHLNLSFSSFTGEVPSEIFHLSRLESLDLSENFVLSLGAISFNKLTQNLTQLRELDLIGVNMSLILPKLLMNLSSCLSSLRLSFCELQGELPDNIFGQSNLQSLDLGFNKDLTGSLRSLNTSNALTSLDLSATNISIHLEHDSVNKLKSIESLFLSGCNFVGSNLALFSNLTQLTELVLSHNNFNGHIPFSLGKLGRLNYLDLGYNDFTGQILDNFYNLTHKILRLDISGNNFHGQVPFFFGNFKLLQHLDLSFNNFFGQFPDVFANLTQLLGLYISHNNFHGQISFSFQNFRFLQDLDLSANNFSGPISDVFANFPQIINLDLSHNNFTGEILDGLANLTRLEYLSLSNNRLIGEIPSQMSHSLEYIDFSHNKLHGPIPPSIFKLEILNFLMLFSNDKLTGEIPTAIYKLKFLRILDLSNNGFSGFIPQCLGNFSNRMSVLHLGGNKFRGNIPPTFLEGDNNLEYLNFDGNQLEGVIPRSIINCKKLIFLDLSNNMIEDTFPFFLETLQDLHVLVLRSNKFYGFVESSFANYSFPQLRIFDLSHNNFSGPLPIKYFNNFKAMMTVAEDLKYMGIRVHNYYDYAVGMTWKGLEIDFAKIHTKLTNIDLSGNNFIGEIPKTIGKLISLEQLNLSHNHLTGHIQPSLGKLINLESLDLSSNMLTGRIPIQLADLTFLGVLNLSYNQLEGPIPGGKQFNTFGTNSYEGNLGLCGFPLEVKCNNGEGKQQPLASFQKEDHSLFQDGFGWKSVATGYGCGFAFGVSIGYVVFKTGKPAWLLRMMGCILHQKAKPNKKNSQRNHGRRPISAIVI